MKKQGAGEEKDSKNCLETGMGVAWEPWNLGVKAKKLSSFFLPDTPGVVPRCGTS